MRTYRGYYNHEPVTMVINGEMADKSKTYIRANSDYGLESDGYIRQYQRDNHNRFYLLTEDRSYT